MRAPCVPGVVAGLCPAQRQTDPAKQAALAPEEWVLPDFMVPLSSRACLPAGRRSEGPLFTSRDTPLAPEKRLSVRTPDFFPLQNVLSDATLKPMPATLEETLLSVFRQSMLEDLPAVILDGRTYPVKRTSRRRLRQVDFEFDGKPLRGLEQNPDTKSRWAQQARAGKRVMQFLGDSGYVAAVVDAHLHLYAESKTKTSP